MLCGLVRWSYAVVFALLFQLSKWVSGCVVLEAVRVVHVIICKCVVQTGVARGGGGRTRVHQEAGAEKIQRTYVRRSQNKTRNKRKKKRPG